MEINWPWSKFWKLFKSNQKMSLQSYIAMYFQVISGSHNKLHLIPTGMHHRVQYQFGIVPKINTPFGVSSHMVKRWFLSIYIYPSSSSVWMYNMSTDLGVTIVRCIILCVQTKGHLYLFMHTQQPESIYSNTKPLPSIAKQKQNPEQ